MFEFCLREVPRSALIDDLGQIRSGNKRVTGSALKSEGAEIDIIFGLYSLFLFIFSDCCFILQ